MQFHVIILCGAAVLALMNLRAAFMLTAVSLLCTHCFKSGGGRTDMIGSFGTFPSPDSTKKIVVTRREKSLVDFQVFDSKSGNELVKDYIGSDAMRWFLYWETPGRLWGYGSDIGYFKLFEFRADGTTQSTGVDHGMPIPHPVWEHLPSSLQKRYKASAPVQSPGERR